GITVAYNNRNLTKNADKLSISVTVGTEFNFSKKASNSNNNRTDFIISTEYYINKFLLPFRIKQLDHTTSARSKIYASYNYENRIGFYKLHNTTFSFGYEWNKNQSIRHSYLPFTVSIIYLPDSSLSSGFKARLDSNSLLKNSFGETFIMGSQYNFYYNFISKNKYHLFNYRLFLETAGNILELGSAIISQKDKNKSVLGRNYAQFFKMTHEFRHQSRVNDNATINTKLKFGIGAPYGNSNSLPYVKQFFIGGPNSIRAFPVRTLGPGGFRAVKTNPNSVIDELGDILLEASVEYRFDIFKWFKGVVFVDAGNIWLRQPDPKKPEAEFNFAKLLKQTAIGTGLGLRLDFDYFVIRYDLGFPVKVNYDSENTQWVIKDAAFGSRTWRQENLVHNIAVGYPF
ncbi:MAG: BamA/TamA family outer membrane protein, partial [Chitinophagales bacterium]|nr:BamA/TamA family outer membrane protein [Chitinophagales bacterium]